MNKKWRKPQDGKMTHTRKHMKKLKEKIQARQSIRRNLSLSIAVLSVIALTFIFKIGESLWPAWMVEYRTLFMSIALFMILFLVFSYPIIVEVDTNPRPLSGPGHNPSNGWRYK